MSQWTRSQTLQWFREGWHRTRDALAYAWVGLGGLVHWLFAPVRGSVRFSLRALELVRAAFTGLTLTGLGVALEYALDHLGVLQLDPAAFTRWSTRLGSALFFIHLLVQLTQRDQGPPHEPKAPGGPPPVAP